MIGACPQRVVSPDHRHAETVSVKGAVAVHSNGSVEMCDLLRDRFRGCLIGLAIGDALGTSVEFMPRGSFELLTGICGGGPFNLEPGQWTDDTSMALCLATSLLECGGFDARDQMERYKRWYLDGYLSSTGTCFDKGRTVRDAIWRYIDKNEPFCGSTDPSTAGNGSIMRLAPVPMFFFKDGVDTIVDFCGESSRVTHGASECVDACEVLGEMIFRALKGLSKTDVLNPEADAVLESSIDGIAHGAYQTKSRSEIFGTGYVVHTLEAAAWCVYHSATFEEAVLLAANLGGDADTIGAVCGQLAGALYGATSVPNDWKSVLCKYDMIQDLADRLYARNLDTA